MSLIQYLGKDKKGPEGSPVIALHLPAELKRYFKAKPNEFVNAEWCLKICQRALDFEKGLSDAEQEVIKRALSDKKFAVNPKPGERNTKYKKILANRITDPHVIAFNEARAAEQQANEGDGSK